MGETWRHSSSVPELKTDQLSCVSSRKRNYDDKTLTCFLSCAPGTYNQGRIDPRRACTHFSGSTHPWYL